MLAANIRRLICTQFQNACTLLSRLLSSHLIPQKVDASPFQEQHMGYSPGQAYAYQSNKMQRGYDLWVLSLPLWPLGTCLPLLPTSSLWLQMMLAIVCLTLPRSVLLDNTWTFLHFDIVGQFKDSWFGSGLMEPTNITDDCRETENTFFFFFCQSWLNTIELEEI